MSFKKIVDKAVKALNESRFNSFTEAKKEANRLKSNGKKAIVLEFYDEKGKFYSAMTFLKRRTIRYEI